MNRKAETPLGFIIFMLVGLVIWFFFAADMIAYWGQLAIDNGTVTGVEAWLLGNLNLIFMVVWLSVAVIGMRGASS